MNFKSIWKPSVVVSVAVVLAAGGGGCRKREAAAAEVPVVIAPELGFNQVVDLPGAVYEDQAASAIHWQPWAKVTFERARAARRLVFMVIALPQHAAFREVLGDLEGDAALVALINKEYVPVLVDGDAAREIGLLTADLSAEIKRPVQSPMFVWLTSDVNPVAWIPVSAGAPGSARDLFEKSHSMVSKSWASDNAYVLTNSAMDNKGRAERMAKRKNEDLASKDPAGDVVRSIRQLASLYDPVSRSFDETGGLFPSSVIDLLASAAINPGLPENIRARSLRTTKELMQDLLPSPMFDPLDGGLFSSRAMGTWTFPSFVRDGNAQARAVVGLLRAYQATGDPVVLDRALGVISFVENSYATADGLFALGSPTVAAAQGWLWTIEEIKKVLPPEDAAWWIKETGMKSLGNLPSEADPQRDYFRRNSLALARPMAEIAAGLSLTPEAFKPRFDATRKLLLKAREARLGAQSKDMTAHAGTCFRMVSAYAAAFCATGDPAFRDKAVALLTKAREVFGDGPKLWMYIKRTEPSISVGRAFLYSLAIQAALDLVDVTSDEKWLAWADDLASFSAEHFTTEEFLTECPEDAKVIDLPITDLAMLFDDSTAGMISFAECRMAARGRPLVESFSRLAIPLPMYALDRPVLHTDLIQATCVRHHGAVLQLGKDLPQPLQTAVERLSLRMVGRRTAADADGVPAGADKIVLPDGSNQVVTTAEALQAVLLPSLKTP